MTIPELESKTRPDRDRFVDFLRGASLLGVIFGHYFMAVVNFDGTRNFDSLYFGNVLEQVRWTQCLTLVFQVMPIFFVVGGFAHQRAWSSVLRRGGGYADFVFVRMARLVFPSLVYITVSLAWWSVFELLTKSHPNAAAIAQLAGQLLWFLGVYLFVALLAPAMWWFHCQAPRITIMGLMLAVVLVDVLRLGAGWEPVKWLNFAFVWLALHQLGFFYADGSVQRRGYGYIGTLLLVIGGSLVVGLAVFGPYGLAMVSVGGEQLSNMAPPTFMLLAFGLAQAGVLLWLRNSLTKWLHRKWPWRIVIIGGGAAMTAFLWHFLALILLYLGFFVLGVPFTATPHEGRFWVMKAVLVVPFLILVSLFVSYFERFDRPQISPRYAGQSKLSTVGAAGAGLIAIVGLLAIALVGFRGPLSNYVHWVGWLPVTPWFGLALVLISLLLIRSLVPANFEAVKLASRRVSPTSTPAPGPAPEA